MKPFQGPLFSAVVRVLPGDEVQVEQLATPAGEAVADVLAGPQRELMKLLVRRNREQFQQGRRYRVEVLKAGKASHIRVQELD